MIKENSASRILQLLKKAKEHPENAKVFKVWADVFDIDEKNQNRLNMEISRCLMLLQSEIDIVIENLNFEVEDEFGCRLLLNSISDVLAIHSLMADWKSLKMKLTREVFLSLGYCRAILPSEEDSINTQDIEEIHSLIDSLKELLESSNLPSYTRSIIHDHIEGITKALHEYKIKGASSLQTAMNTIVGDIILKEDVLKESKESEEVKLLGSVLKKTKQITDNAVNTEKFLSSAGKLANYGAKALEIINDVM